MGTRTTSPGTALTRAKQLMKLYVWEDVLWDYSHGMIVALAPDMETALALARESRHSESAPADMGKTAPEVTELGWVASEPKLWLVHGGG